MLPILLSALGVDALGAGAAMKMPLPLPIKSSVFASASYIVESGGLTITFKRGETYRYSGVPVNVVLGFISAGSQGAYYDKKIKGKF